MKCFYFLLQAGALSKRGMGLQLRKDSGSDVSCRFSLNRYEYSMWYMVLLTRNGPYIDK